MIATLIRIGIANIILAFPQQTAQHEEAAGNISATQAAMVSPFGASALEVPSLLRPQDDVGALTISELSRLDDDKVAPELWRRLQDAQGSDFDQLTRALLRIAQLRFVAGDDSTAQKIANNLWLSSSPHDVRVMAWKILYLIEHEPRILSDGHVVILEAPGGRDHRRFTHWLKEEFVGIHDWILDVDVEFQLTLIAENRAGENAIVRFVVKTVDDQRRLCELLNSRPYKYPTSEWKLMASRRISDEHACE